MSREDYAKLLEFRARKLETVLKESEVIRMILDSPYALSTLDDYRQMLRELRIIARREIKNATRH